jgi:hypothetical protein
MPVTHQGNGFSFSGKVVAWIDDIELWYKSEPHSLGFADWSALVIYSYSLVAREKWRKEWLGKKKAEKLDEWLPTDKDLVVTAKIMDVLDYLAENLDDKFRYEHEGKAREYASRFNTYRINKE